MKPSQDLNEHIPINHHPKEKFPLMKYTTILIIGSILATVAYLFYDIYQQKKQNEQIQAASLAQEKQDQISIYQETLLYEKEGFEHIKQKNYTQAISSFYKASSLTPSFHDVEEIASLLSKNKVHMDDPKIKMAVLKEIINKHAKHAPTGFTTNLQSQINELEIFAKNRDEKEQALKKSGYYEQEGFTHLLNEEYKSALRSFQKANQFTASFHDIPPLIALLSKHQYEMAEPTVKMKVLNEIVNHYATYAPEGFEETINSRINYSEKVSTSKQAVVYEQKGFQYILEKEYDKAIESFNHAHKLNPSFHNSKAIAKLLTQHHSKMQQFKVKRDVLKEIMDKYAQHAPEGFMQTIASELLQEQKEIQALAYERRGYHYLVKENYQDAQDAFTKASKALPSFHYAQELATLLNEHHKEMDNYETKRKVLNEIIDNYSKYAPSDFVYSLKKQLKQLVKPVHTEHSVSKEDTKSENTQPLLRLDYSMAPKGEK
jgi:tetratricopeptide (TPR) repeat protein